MFFEIRKISFEYKDDRGPTADHACLQRLKQFKLFHSLQAMGGFGPIFQSDLRGGKIYFFLCLGASATKSFARSRIFRYGLPEDMKEPKGGRGVQHPAPSVNGLTILFNPYL